MTRNSIQLFFLTYFNLISLQRLQRSSIHQCLFMFNYSQTIKIMEGTQTVHQVVIIGAGISGLGASNVLSAAFIPHLILQSRNIFGGRICSNTLSGVKIDMGANYVHYFSQNHQITKFIKKQNLQTVWANNQLLFYYEKVGILQHPIIQQVDKLYKKAYQCCDRKAQQAPEDISLAQGLSQFYSELNSYPPVVKNTVYSKLKQDGNNDGADLSEISAKKRANLSMLDDKLVKGGGYPMVIQKIYNKFKKNIIFSTKVLSIDYSGSYVHLKTTNGQFFAKKVISSIPLGVLKERLVYFKPQLPEAYQIAIQSIGVGNLNKLFVHFKKPFWKAEGGYLYFVTQQKYNRYSIGYILPNNQNKHILLIDVAGNSGKQVLSLSEQQIRKDLYQFLTRFVKQDQFQIQDSYCTRWSKDENFLGSYTYNKVGTKQEHYEQFRKPIQQKIWFVGEHTHPTWNSYAHGAYQTGIWAAQEVIQSLLGEKSKL